MCLLTVMIVWAVLGVSTADSHQEKIETLMDNVVILKVPEKTGSQVNVPLTCGEAYETTRVLWKKNGAILKRPLQKNRIKVLVEEMQGGNFSCHRAETGEYLNHTLVMVQLDPDNRTVILTERPSGGYIHCRAPNYDGPFHCNWSRDSFRSKAAVLLVNAKRDTEKIVCDINADGSGVQCHNANCASKEEHHRISITVYIHNMYRLEVYTKNFYLRDIVKPGNLPNLRLSDGNVFRWDYPAHWSRPCTFFSLHFQIKEVPIGQSCDSDTHIMLNTTDEAKYDVSDIASSYILCVRAQDKFTQGLWSHWSHCIVQNDDATC